MLEGPRRSNGSNLGQFTKSLIWHLDPWSQTVCRMTFSGQILTLTSGQGKTIFNIILHAVKILRSSPSLTYLTYSCILFHLKVIRHRRIGKYDTRWPLVTLLLTWPLSSYRHANVLSKRFFNDVQELNLVILRRELLPGMVHHILEDKKHFKHV